jgi:hypothetical protein
LKEEIRVQGRRILPDDNISYVHLSLSWWTQRACSRLLDSERMILEAHV